ncbi:MAG: hypothetical protein MOGMAGMI_00195 [Candidatus Omnitrophica bacterium]|nr:hypothetical protein [Candidatus Omnitrophota bacterium]
MRTLFALIVSSLACASVYAAEPVDTQMPEGGSTSEITAKQAAAEAVVDAQQALTDLLRKTPEDKPKANEPIVITNRSTHIQDGRPVTVTVTEVLGDDGVGRPVRMVTTTTDAMGAPVIKDTVWDPNGGLTQTVVTDTTITIGIYDKNNNLVILPGGVPNPRVIPTREIPKPKPAPGPSS